MKDPQAGDSLPRKGSKEKPGPPEDLPLPIQVIADIVFTQGLFYVSVENISDQPAYQVSISWKPSFRGLGGTQVTSELPLFKNIEFLAPHKAIKTLLDTSQAYFTRREPTHLEATIQHQDALGRGYRHTIRHNLEIYRDLVYQTPSDRPIGSGTAD